jgi:hypothetical protein
MLNILFMYSLAIHTLFFENCLFNPFVHLLIGLFFLLMFNFGFLVDLQGVVVLAEFTILLVLLLFNH